MDKITFEEATLVTPAKVNEDGTITPAVWEGNTPLTPHTLNLMQDNIETASIAVSPTEPTTKEKVWIKKGKNLVDVSKIIVGYGLWDTDGTTLKHEQRGYFNYILVNSNIEYSISNCTLKAICFYDKNETFISAVSGVTTFTTPSNCTYVRFAIDITVDYSTIQLEQSPIATDYEEYVEKEIYVKNDNGVWERFYSESDLQNKTKTIWNGSLYETNGSIELTEALKTNNIYIFTFYGLSANYLLQVPFTFKNGYFQTAYYDGTNYFRIRLDILNNGKTVRVNSASVNNASNTALIAIEKV